MTTKTKKTTAKKTSKPAAPKASKTTNAERQVAYRLRHNRPMSLSPAMTDARAAYVLSSWSPEHKKRVASLLAKAPK